MVDSNNLKLERYQSFQSVSNSFHDEKIRQLKSLVLQYFRIYDIRWNEKTVAFYVEVNQDNLEQHFENLRIQLKKFDYLPRIGFENGEYVIYIIPHTNAKKRSIWINIILMILTLFTTTWAGAIIWFSRLDISNGTYGLFDPLLNFESVIFGFLSFALPLMVILGTHETAHYLAAKKHNIDASLPYFIPLPPPFILGTMGAFISMREPISNKKALLDIGAAGPIAGFIVSIPILIIGFTLEILYPVKITEFTSDLFVFNEPLLFTGLRLFFPGSENTLMHPTAFAGWVGLFVTALNLIPGGQLDGGHIARALLGRAAKYLSFIVILILFFLSIITGFYLWVFFAFIIIILGTSHPPPLNDISPLGNRRKTIGAFCMVILLLCIHYSPITEVSVPDYDLKFELDNPDQVIDVNESSLFDIKVINNGDSKGDVKFSHIILDNTNSSKWNSEFILRNSKNEIITNWKNFILKKKDYFTILVNVAPHSNLSYGEKITYRIFVTISDLNKVTESIDISTMVGTFDLSTNEPRRAVNPGNDGRFYIVIKNLLNQNNTINLTYNLNSSLNLTGFDFKLDNPLVNIGPKEQKIIYFEVFVPFNTEKNIIIIELVGHMVLMPEAYDKLILVLEIKSF